jgi:hypothetical protein
VNITHQQMTDRHVFKLNKLYLACERQTDMKKNAWGVFSRNIYEGASDEMKI